MPNNFAKIAFGERTIDPYLCTGLSVQEACVDAVTDLFHVIHDNGIKVEDIIRIAKSHFNNERED